MITEHALLKMIENIQTLARLTSHTALSDLARGENYILAYLERHGGSAMASDMCKHMSVSKARISAVLHMLETKHFITKESDLSDKRRIHICITECGKQYLINRRQQTYESASAIFNRLDEQDLEEYIRLTDKIISLTEEEKNMS